MIELSLASFSPLWVQSSSLPQSSNPLFAWLVCAVSGGPAWVTSLVQQEISRILGALCQEPVTKPSRILLYTTWSSSYHLPTLPLLLHPLYLESLKVHPRCHLLHQSFWIATMFFPSFKLLQRLFFFEHNLHSLVINSNHCYKFSLSNWFANDTVNANCLFI